MKKLLVILLVFVSSYSFAQGLGTVKLMNYEAKQYMKQQQVKQKEQVDTLQKAIQEAVKKKEQEELNKRKNQNKVPFYYYGKEMKVVALGELTYQKLKAKKQVKQKEVKQDSTKKEHSLWRAIFFNGQFPGESDEHYRERIRNLGHPSNLPLK